MLDVYSKPISLELNRDLIQHYRIESVMPDEFDSEVFIAKYEVFDDEKKAFYPFEVRVPKAVCPDGAYWKPVFESIGSLYTRKEDKLTYGYKIIQLIIDGIFKQTKQAPPKKVASDKVTDSDVVPRSSLIKEKQNLNELSTKIDSDI